MIIYIKTKTQITLMLVYFFKIKIFCGDKCIHLKCI